MFHHELFQKFNLRLVFCCNVCLNVMCFGLICFALYCRYHFFLQVKRDILEGRLVTPTSTAALLASFAIQCKGHYSVFCIKQREGILHSLI